MFLIYGKKQGKIKSKFELKIVELVLLEGVNQVVEGAPFYFYRGRPARLMLHMVMQFICGYVVNAGPEIMLKAE